MDDNSMSSKPGSEMSHGSINSHTYSDSIGTPFTHCQLYASIWKSCKASQYNVLSRHKHIYHRDKNVFSDSLMKKLRSHVFTYVSDTRQKTPVSWSVYHNFRAMFKLPFVAHCEGTDPGNKVEDAIQKADYDKVLQYKAEEDSLRAEVLDCIANETIKDRIDVVLSPHYGEYEQMSPQLQMVSRSILYITAISFLGGMFIGSRRGRLDFLAKNQGTTFYNASHATRRMQEEIFKCGLTDAFKFCIRLVPLGTLAVVVIQSIAVCRNKSSPLEYTVAVGLVYALANINRGPKGMVSGAIFGSLFGGLAGLFMCGVLKYAKHTEQEMHYRQIEARIIAKREEKRKPDRDDEPSDVDMA